MATTPVVSMLLWLLLTIGGGGGTAKSGLCEAMELQDAEDCPRCDTIFSMLETTPMGGRVQKIKMRERGEPKSGTTFMFHWAHGALLHTCNSLNDWFGSGTCRVQTKVGANNAFFRGSVEIIFEPRLAGADAKCPCPEVDMVNILISDAGKHRLPVGDECRFRHNSGISKSAQGCSFVDGRSVENLDDIVLCMEEAACNIIDDSFQFVIMRDPRPQAVSTFYHLQVHPDRHANRMIGAGLDTIDDFVLNALPTICRWMSIRYSLFTGPMAHQSTLFWYDEAVSDAVTWHNKWLASVGLNLTETVVERMVQATEIGKFDFKTLGRNDHPGKDEEGARRNEKAQRSWKDDLNPEILEEIDNILRHWLPPVILAKLEVLP